MLQQEFNLAKLLKALWRFKWMIAILVLVAAGTAWKFTSMQSPVYQATATVMVENSQPPLNALPTSLQSGPQYVYLQDIGSQIKVIESRSVLERAATQLEPEKTQNHDYLQLKVSQLSNALKVQQVGGTSLVAVTITASNPATAQKQANAVAEAYVYEVSQAKLTAIEASLENTTQELKELNAAKVDLSISPLLTPIAAQIDTALAAIAAADDHLEKLGAAPGGQATGESAPVAKDAGTVLTPLQLSTLSQRVDDATSEAQYLSALAQQLNGYPPGASLEERYVAITVFESQTRALETKLGSLSAEVTSMQGVEIDPQVHDQLLAVAEQLQVAKATTSATLDQVLSLYSVEQQLRLARMSEVDNSAPVVAAPREAETDLLRRMVQHTALAASTLEDASGQLQKIQPRAATLNQWELQNLVEILRERLSGGTSSPTAVLETISKELKPPAPDQGVLLTHDELASMQNTTRIVATTLAFLQSEVEQPQLNQLEPQAYTELLSIREWLRIANDAAQGLPGQIAALDAGGGGNLSSSALDNLRQQLQLQLLTSSSSGSRVMDTAQVSSPTATFSGGLRNIILAVVAALLLGILGVMVIQGLDRKVRDASQLAGSLGLPVLACVARMKGTGNPHPPSLLKANASQCLESFRMLRTNLGLDSKQGQVILISSPGEEEGKTTVAANLARAVALQGRKVLLIDGNLRKPGIADAFGLTKTNGLSQFLTGEKGIQDYVAQADGVDILAVAGASARSAEELSSPRMQALLEKARQAYDIVIVDSAPVTGYADTRILAKEADAALLVLQADVSTLDAARESKQALETTGVRVAGLVLNKEKSQEPRNPSHLFHKLQHRKQPVTGDRAGG